MPLQGIHEFLETHVIGGHAPGTRMPVDAKEEESKKGEHGNTADKAMKKGRYISNQIMAYMKWYHSKAPHPPKPDLHKWTKAILNTLRSMRWVPLKAEAPVLVRDWCLRTRIDLLVYDAKNKRVMVVEIKTGYADGAFQKARGTFAPPFEFVANSPCNRAYAQALIALAMTRVDTHARYTWMPAATGAWVLCVNDDGVTTCGSAPWSRDFVNHWARFLQHHGAQRIGDRTLSAPTHAMTMAAMTVKMAKDEDGDEEDEEDDEPLIRYAPSPPLQPASTTTVKTDPRVDVAPPLRLARAQSDGELNAVVTETENSDETLARDLLTELSPGREGLHRPTRVDPSAVAVLAHLVARPRTWVDTAQLARATRLAPTVIRGLEAALRGLVVWRHDGRRILLMADTPALVAQALAEMAGHRIELERLAGVSLSDPEFSRRLLPALLDQQRVTWEFDDQFVACVSRAMHIEACSRRLRAYTSKH